MIQYLMIKFKGLFFVLMVFVIYSCVAQKNIKKGLIGKWILVKTDKGLTEIEPFDADYYNQKETNSKTTLIFYENDSLVLNQSSQIYNTTYETKDSVLILGNRKYIIQVIKKHKLKLIDDSDFAPTEYIYKKIE